VISFLANPPNTDRSDRRERRFIAAFIVALDLFFGERIAEIVLLTPYSNSADFNQNLLHEVSSIIILIIVVVFLIYGTERAFKFLRLQDRPRR
jgi:hypothetical protein